MWPRRHGNICSFWRLILCYVYACFACMHSCVPHVCPVPSLVRWAWQIALNFCYRRLWAAMWVLGVEPGSSAEEAGALNGWVISPAPKSTSLFCLHVPELEMKIAVFEWVRDLNPSSAAHKLNDLIQARLPFQVSVLSLWNSKGDPLQQGEGRELPPKSCPLTSTYIKWYACVHTTLHIYTIFKNNSTTGVCVNSSRNLYKALS